MLMHVIWLNYGIPSVLLILFFLKFLNRPEFKYSFYRVLQCDMVMNLLCYVNTWIQRLCNVSSTIPTMLWFYQNAYFIFPIQSYFGHFFFNEQAMSVIILSLHRFSSSVSTLGNEFWSRNYLRAYAVVILLSTAITTPIYFGEYMKPYIYVSEKQAFQSGPVDTDKRSVASTVFSIQMWTYFTVIFTINIFTIIAVRKRFSSEFTSPKTRTLMRNLTTIAFLNTIVFAFVILWQPFYKAVVEFDRTINNYVMMFLSDALSLTLPYILLICDRNNVICYLNTWVYRLCYTDVFEETMIRVLENFPFVFGFSAFFGYFFYNAQAMSVIIMSLHRLWSARSTTGNEFWNRNYLRAYLLILVISTCLSVPIYFGDYFLPFVYSNQTREFVPGEPEEPKGTIFIMFFLFQCIFYFLIILLINLWTICAVRKHFKTNNKSTDPKTRVMMRNLTTIVFINTFVFFCVIIWQLFGNIIIRGVSGQVQNIIVMAMSDVLSLSLPYILIVFDRNVRSTIVKMLDDKKLSVKVESIAPGATRSTSRPT